MNEQMDKLSRIYEGKETITQEMRRKRRTRIRIRVALVMVAMVVVLGGLLWRKYALKITEKEGRKEDAVPAKETLESLLGDCSTTVECGAYFLNVGEGAAVLFASGDTYILVDGGGRDTGRELVSYLKAIGVERLALVIATHYDADHIGGLIDVLEQLPVDEVWGPDYMADTATATRFLLALEGNESVKNSGTVWGKLTVPTKGDSYKFGDVDVEVLGPIDTEGLEENDSSLVVKVHLQGVKVLISGDATSKVEEQLVAAGSNLSCDIYYVAHHGSYSSSSEDFLKAMDASYGVISVGENEYGHPHDSCLQRLENAGMKVLRTDREGTIIAEFRDGVIQWK